MIERISVVVIRQDGFRIDQLRLISADKKCGGVTHDNPTSLQESVVRAVDKWIRNTDNGKQCFAYAGDDLNIGDLSSYLEDEDLICHLRDEGVANLKVEEPDFSEWNYDTPLTTIQGYLDEDNNLVEDE